MRRVVTCVAAALAAACGSDLTGPRAELLIQNNLSVPVVSVRVHGRELLRAPIPAQSEHRVGLRGSGCWLVEAWTDAYNGAGKVVCFADGVVRRMKVEP